MKLATYLNEQTLIGRILPIYLYEGDKVVKARDLHESLESKQDFYNWSTKAIVKNCDVVEMDTNVETRLNYPKVVLGKALKYVIKSTDIMTKDKVDYLLDIDTAKHIAMISKTEKGKIIRDYFIEIEKQYTEMLQIERNEALSEAEKARHRSRLDKRNAEYNKKVNKKLRKQNEDLVQELAVVEHYMHQAQREAYETNQILENLKEQHEELKDEYEYINESYKDLQPNLKAFYTIDKHGFSNNYMYKDIIIKGRIQKIKTDQYKKWINDFLNQMAKKGVSKEGVDFNKPVGIWLYYDHQEKMDVTNFVKSTIDVICKYFKVDDNRVEIMACRTTASVETINEGKIHFSFKNVQPLEMVEIDG